MTNKETKHTEISYGKWIVLKRGDSFGVTAEQPNGNIEFVANCGDATCQTLPCNKNAEDNARFIVKACNNHERLVDALASILGYAEERRPEFDEIGGKVAMWYGAAVSKASNLLSEIEKDGE